MKDDPRPEFRIGELNAMEPALMALLMALPMLAAVTARVIYQWIKSRTAVRLAQLHQQGLSDRARYLPPGSRMSERSEEREVVIEVGRAVAKETAPVRQPIASRSEGTPAP